MPFWRENFFTVNRCKSYTAFHCNNSYNFFKQACLTSKTVFQTVYELQRDVIEKMNEIIGQKCFYWKDTGTYVKIVCIGKCPWESWLKF